MIEIVLTKNEYIKFTAEARKRMKERGWNIAHLAKAINRPQQSVYNFFSRENVSSRYIAAEIADALDMNLQDLKGGD